ncbi:hypothetical protein Q5424_23465 [Conexibacter sp. JD483]|uniref:hypothetical protein n=1 Tax=unclassified Conexibacter TaxID=2627773 RepID=UPI00271D1381|nr:MULTISPECIES: hypothetical protein [unclassified Conexibacter]MDO8185671.1 hypothetical protein [Conexibacter sp. CPCC 205706]MDO8198844.1 hypothetical protein [Conexibacter sp. CPCC 205762]MDR9372077.1 hypothetical protein [Conexibacter sp. JD483]
MPETLAILSDRATLEKIREGDAAIAADDSISLEALRAQLQQSSSACLTSTPQR